MTSRAITTKSEPRGEIESKLSWRGEQAISVEEYTMI